MKGMLIGADRSVPCTSILGSILTFGLFVLRLSELGHYVADASYLPSMARVVKALFVYAFWFLRCWFFLLSAAGDVPANPLLLLVPRSDPRKFSNFGVPSIAYADSPVPFISKVEVELILMNYLDFRVSVPKPGYFESPSTYRCGS